MATKVILNVIPWGKLGQYIIDGRFLLDYMDCFLVRNPDFCLYNGKPLLFILKLII